MADHHRQTLLLEEGLREPTDGRRRILQVSILVAGAIAILWLLWPRGGLRGVYSVELASGTIVPLHARVDPSVDFPDPELLRQPFVQHWNLPRLGVPASLPPFRVQWTGLLRAPREGLYRFHVEAAGTVRLLVDGRALMPEAGREAEGTAVRLTEGWHALDLTYRRTDEAPRIRFLWESPGSGAPVVVPRRFLAASRQALALRRPAQLVGLLLGLGWLLVVLRVWKRGKEPGSLGRFIVEHRHGVALCAILLLGLALRLHQYDQIPFHHETADEYQHGWEGWTLLHEGAPRAWTFYPWIYPRQDLVPLVWFGDPYNLVRPYFDHPPGFSLLVGGVSTILGAEQMLDCTLWRMRLVPIFLGLLTLVLVARAGWSLLDDPLGGTLAALLYATLPIIVLGNRLVKAESLLAPLLLLQVLWLERYLSSGRRGDLVRIALSGAASLWAKATGVAVPAVAMLSLVAARRWKGAAVAGGAAAAAVVAYLAYGAFYGWGIFGQVLALQSSKLVAVRTVLDLIGISRVVELQFGTGWYLWLLLAAAGMALGPHRRLLAPAAVYFVLLSATADSRSVFGWYRLPLFPFLCLAGGLFLAAWFREADLGRSFLFAATALATTLYHLLPVADERSRIAVVLLFLLACGLPLGARLFPSAVGRPLRAWSVVISLAVFFAGNALIVEWQVPIYLQEAVRSKVPGMAGAVPAAAEPAEGREGKGSPPAAGAEQGTP